MSLKNEKRKKKFPAHFSPLWGQSDDESALSTMKAAAAGLRAALEIIKKFRNSGGEEKKNEKNSLELLSLHALKISSMLKVLYRVLMKSPQNPPSRAQ
jgi:hypothetical protein